MAFNYSSAATEVAHSSGNCRSVQAHLRQVISDGNGNCVLNGYFMDTLLLGVNDTLYNTLGGLWTNIFLASIDPNGQVNWKRNLTRENPDAYEVGCLARHPDGSVWYAPP